MDVHRLRTLQPLQSQRLRAHLRQQQPQQQQLWKQSQLRI
jgi:hypothetical protein